jgi:hypothetical protein
MHENVRVLRWELPEVSETPTLMKRWEGGVEGGVLIFCPKGLGPTLPINWDSVFYMFAGSGSGSVAGRGAVPLKAARRYDWRGQESSRYNIQHFH